MSRGSGVVRSRRIASAGVSAPSIEGRANVRGGASQVVPNEVVFMSAYAMGRSEEVWDEPMRFDPDRFSPENEAKLHRFDWVRPSSRPTVYLAVCLAGWLASWLSINPSTRPSAGELNASKPMRLFGAGEMVRSETNRAQIHPVCSTWMIDHETISQDL